MWDRLSETTLMYYAVVAGKEHDEPEDIKVDAPAEEAPALKTEDET